MVSTVLWMDEILHHFEAMGNHCLLVFTGNQTIPGLLRWCRILSIHPMNASARLFFFLSSVPISWPGAPRPKPGHARRVVVSGSKLGAQSSGRSVSVCLCVYVFVPYLFGCDCLENKCNNQSRCCFPVAQDLMCGLVLLCSYLRFW